MPNNNAAGGGLSIIPNLFTLLNLLFGCLAIVFTLQNGITIFADSTGAQLVDIPERIYMASLFIGLAGVVDFFDGFLARLLRADSAMGKQLDSLADVVSFGVAPGMIIYQFLRLSFAQEENGLDTSFLYLIPAFLIPSKASLLFVPYRSCVIFFKEQRYKNVTDENYGNREPFCKKDGKYGVK